MISGTIYQLIVENSDSSGKRKGLRRLVVIFVCRSYKHTSCDGKYIRQSSEGTFLHNHPIPFILAPIVNQINARPVIACYQVVDGP